MAHDNTWAVHVKSQTDPEAVITITPGTDKAIRVLGRPTITPIGQLLVDRTDARSPDGPGVRPVPGSRQWEIAFQTELFEFADYDDYTTTAMGPLWAGAGVITEGASALVWKQSNVMTRSGSASVGTGVVPFTIYLDNIGGDRFVAHNCVATVELARDGGGRVLLSWTIHGLYNAPAKSTLAAETSVYDTALPFVSQGCTASDYLANLVGIGAFSLTTGVEIKDREVVTETLGFASPVLNFSAMPMLSVSAEAEDETALASWAGAFAATQRALELELTGSCQIRITMPEAYETAPPSISGDAIAMYDRVFGGVPDASGVSLTITWEDA